MSDLISRCELFNRLATIQAQDVNDLKGQIYAIIQTMETKENEQQKQGGKRREGTGATTKESRAYECTQRATILRYAREC